MTEQTQSEQTLADVLGAAGKGEMGVEPFKTLLGREKAANAAKILAEHWASLPKAVRGLLRGGHNWPANIPTPKRVELQSALAAKLVGNEAIEDRLNFARSLILCVARAAEDPKATKTTPVKAAQAFQRYWITEEGLEAFQELDIAGLDEKAVDLCVRFVSRSYRQFTKGKSMDKTAAAREQLRSWLGTLTQHHRGLEECDRLLVFLDGKTAQAEDQATPHSKLSAVVTSPERTEPGIRRIDDLKEYREAHRKLGKALDHIKSQTSVASQLQKQIKTISSERDALGKELAHLKDIAADHNRRLNTAQLQAQQADRQRMEVVGKLEVATEDNESLRSEIERLKSELENTAAAAKQALDEKERAKSGSRDDVVRARKNGKEELAAAIAGKLNDRFKQIDSFLELEPSVDQIEAMRDQIRDLKNSLRASGVEVGG